MKTVLVAILSLLISMPVVSKERATLPSSFAFIENKGQVTDQYYHSRNDIDLKLAANGVSVFIGVGVMHYQFANYPAEKHGIKDKHRQLGQQEQTVSTYRMDVTLSGYNPNAQLVMEEPLSYYEVHYTSGTHQPAHSFKKARYKNIYPGIDWVLYIKNGRLEQEFVLQKGADASLIKIKCEGASEINIHADGSLTLTTPMGEVKEHAPFAYQPDGSKVSAAYRLNANIIGYELGNYEGELTIDPTLVWGSYYGGTGNEYGTATTADGGQGIYLAGKTNSLTNIATVGSHQATLTGSFSDAFLAKFDTSGQLLWATYYGGQGDDLAFSVTSDIVGNVFICGLTSSQTGIATIGSHQPLIAFQANGFIAKFNADGIRQWGTYYGGDDGGGTHIITCDDSCNLYYAGTTSSTFNIATAGSFQPTKSAGLAADAFLVRFDSNGVRQWGTYFGDIGDDNGNVVKTDHAGNVFLVGNTGSLNMATSGTHQTAFGGYQDAYIAKFNGMGQRIWCSYYGGVNNDEGNGLVVKGDKVYISGYTESPNAMSTTGSYQPAMNGSSDLFVAQFDTAGQRYWGTYLGGDGDEYPAWYSSLAATPAAIFVAGNTYSMSGVVLPFAHQPVFGGGATDAFLAKMDDNGTPYWSTYYGGCAGETACGVTTDIYGNAYIAGYTPSMESISTPGGFQPVYGGGANDAFLARFNDVPHLQDTITGDTSACENDVLTYSLPPVTGANSYTWVLPNGWTGTSTTNTITATVTPPGGVISVIAHRACINDTFSLPVTVHPLPQPVLSLSIATFSTGSFTSYQWYYNGTLITGATNQSHTATIDGNYFVIVTDINGCSNSSDTLAVSNTAVANVELAHAIFLYPNPANNEVHILSPDNSINEVNIYSITGALISSQNITTKDVKVNTAALPTGPYILRIKTDKGTGYKRLQVLK
ncbi:MAG: T9SS type A sorting domain-containing protein [Flavipsychrobacter sp.]|nr:T9SS type A sorting domain-containing protein [Flavipsychrobacter sp.]